MTLTKSDYQAIWEEVKANHAALDACVGPHDFSIEHERMGTLVRKYRCTKCGGTIDSIDRTWYLSGLAHGRKTSQPT